MKDETTYDKIKEFTERLSWQLYEKRAKKIDDALFEAFTNTTPDQQ